MQAWNSFSYYFGPVIALAGIGLMVLVLRWEFAHGGSLVPIAIPNNYLAY